MKIYSLLLYAVYILHQSSVCNGIFKYKCVNDHHCLKLYPAEDTGVDPAYSNLNHCRLLCGKYGPLWPRPTGEVELSKQTVAIDRSNIRFEHNVRNQSDVGMKVINTTMSNFVQTVQQECNEKCVNTTGVPLTIRVFVVTNSSELDWSTDESYTLNVANDSTGMLVATVQANTIFGARHGCESLSQLFATVTDHSNFPNCSLHMLSRATIHDQPIYAHRGLLVDTARNFIPVVSLKRQLNAMAASKMNVLHWHVSDTQSFPIVLESVPEMLQYGPYSSEEIYTAEAVEELVQYAKYRGIRVIFELDAPAHAGNGWQWGPEKGLGNLALCINEQPWRKFCIEPPCGQLNPVNPNLYDVLQNVLREFATFNRDEPIIHMGGDEVFFGCWNASEEVVKYMSDHGMGRSEKDFLLLWSKFQNKVLQLWDNARSTFVPKIPDSANSVYNYTGNNPSVIEHFLPSERYVVQTWLPSASNIPNQLRNLGYRLIISTKDAWYLDHGFWGQTSYYSWKKVYNNRLLQGNGILGGEVCVWTEFIDSQSLDGRTWPRAAAAAERLWSNPKTGAVDAEPRFFRHRDRLIARGIQPEAVAPMWCQQNEGQCH